MYTFPSYFNNNFDRDDSTILLHFIYIDNTIQTIYNKILQTSLLYLF
jgi:hypothetical protein